MKKYGQEKCCRNGSSTALCDSWTHTGRDLMAVKQHGQLKSIEVTALFQPPFWKIWGKQNCNSSSQRVHTLNLEHFIIILYYKVPAIFSGLYISKALFFPDKRNRCCLKCGPPRLWELEVTKCVTIM